MQLKHKLLQFIYIVYNKIVHIINTTYIHHHSNTYTIDFLFQFCLIEGHYVLYIIYISYINI